MLADPDFGGRFPPLPYTRQEAAAILELAPASERFAVLGREASRAAVLSGALRDYRFLHFATHGSFAATDPGGGRLVLAQSDPHGRPEANGFLHLADIYELDLRADLVVLSACQSALGREVRGEGMMGMTRGFFYAGAERVLVSLWNVNDRVTVELMRRFYRGMLAEGLSPAAALRAAQDAIRRQARWRAPYYWAGFTLQGEWRGERPRCTQGPGSPASPVRGTFVRHQARSSRSSMPGGLLSVPAGSLTVPLPPDATSIGDPRVQEERIPGRAGLGVAGRAACGSAGFLLSIVFSFRLM